jgi:hypothetical protein
MTGENYRPPAPAPASAEYQLRYLSAWWDREHQRAGVPHVSLCSLIEYPLATRGAIRERANGWKWHMPQVVLAVPRGGYGALWLRIHGRRPPKEESALPAHEVDAGLRLAGNCVISCGRWQEAVQAICDYLAGKFEREE